MGLRFALKEPISFKGWNGALRDSALSPYKRGVFKGEIIALLHFCRRAPVTIELIRLYLQEVGVQESTALRRALLWFVAHAPVPAKEDQGAVEPVPSRVQGKPEEVPVELSMSQKTGCVKGGGGLPLVELRRSDTPRLAGADGLTGMGAAVDRGVPGEGVQWRTEETYRMWAQWFAKFIARKRAPTISNYRQARRPALPGGAAGEYGGRAGCTILINCGVKPLLGAQLRRNRS